MVRPSIGEYVFHGNASVLVDRALEPGGVHMTHAEGRRMLAEIMGLRDWDEVCDLPLDGVVDAMSALDSERGRQRVTDGLKNLGVVIGRNHIEDICRVELAYPGGKPAPSVEVVSNRAGSRVGVFLGEGGWVEHEGGARAIRQHLFSAAADSEQGLRGNDLVPRDPFYFAWSSQSPAFAVGQPRALFVIRWGGLGVMGRRVQLDSLADSHGFVPFLHFHRGFPGLTHTPQYLHGVWSERQVVIGASGPGIAVLHDLQLAIAENDLEVRFGRAHQIDSASAFGLYLVRASLLGEDELPWLE